MFNIFKPWQLPDDQSEITVGGRHLWELHAKVVDAVVGSCDPDVEVFQGVGRSSINVLKNRRTGRMMQLSLDFIGSKKETYHNRAEFEALFMSEKPVEVSILDGYFYDVVLTGISEGMSGIPDVCTSVTYKFSATRRGPWSRFTMQAKDFPPAKFFSPSTFPKSDCIIRIRDPVLNGDDEWSVKINGLRYKSNIEITGDLEFNGVDKIITIGGRNVTGAVQWTDFPYVIPGENTVQFTIENFPMPINLEIEYAPVYL